MTRMTRFGCAQEVINFLHTAGAVSEYWQRVLVLATSVDALFKISTHSMYFHPKKVLALGVCSISMSEELEFNILTASTSNHPDPILFYLYHK